MGHSPKVFTEWKFSKSQKRHMKNHVGWRMTVKLEIGTVFCLKSKSGQFLPVKEFLIKVV